MKKCTICKFGSWVVGLSSLLFALKGFFGIALLPYGPVLRYGYLLIAIIAVSFLYYQIVPCPRCVATNKVIKKL